MYSFAQWNHRNALNIIKTKAYWGAWVAQPVKSLTLDLRSGLDLKPCKKQTNKQKKPEAYNYINIYSHCILNQSLSIQ